MGPYVVGLADLDAHQVDVAGSKGARLGALMRIDGVRVPDGFVVTTHAFRQAWTAAGADPDALVVSDEVAAAITDALADLGATTPVAVRSSATAEDLPTASFAGQHDSFLDVVGPAAVIEHVRTCWASLFTDRAVAYRRHQGLDPRGAAMAVVVQRMVPARAAGVLFTADPVTGHRRVASIEAVAGLGEALVSGRVTPDRFTVRDGEVVVREVAGHEGGGAPVLTDAQALELVSLGRRFEAHLGHPQDVEWCLDDAGIHVVQARPITTLFPVPATDDDALHVYVSVGHQQMMTDPMTPLGLSVWQLTSPAPMVEAGGRLFVDVTHQLASPATRDGLVQGLGRSDPLIGDALQTVVDRGLVATLPTDGAPAGGAPGGGASARPHHHTAPPEELPTDRTIVAELVAHAEASLAELERDLATRSGTALLDAVRDDIPQLRTRLFDPRSLQAITAGMEAARWLDEHLEAWLGERGAADTLAQSAPGNVTAEMGLALLDVADAIRPHPEVVAFLAQLDADDDGGFLHALPRLPGGDTARQAIVGFLDRYGMRCVGEIDIARPRWRERPAALVPLILSNVRTAEPGAGRRRFEDGRRRAEQARHDLVQRVRALPDGEQKAAELEATIDRLRTFAGYREYPKYAMVSRYLLYRQALLREADALVRAGVLEPDDVFFLRFDEVHEAVRTGRVDAGLVRDRRGAFASYVTLTPPRVLTSDGEVVTGAYRRDGMPDGALVGLGVSAGVVEGRARVVATMAEADLEPGDVLVTTATDPSWTPVFVTAAALVTEVGGRMTHGAVVAREYGLPAVVGVEHATRRIRDGQRIRVDGAAGFVELLDE